MKKIIFVVLAFIVIYFGIVQMQVLLVRKHAGQMNVGSESQSDHQVHNFNFEKYNSGGGKEIEISGDTANLMEEVVLLSNVMAKAYAEEVAVTITSDKGKYHKTENKVDLEKNVVATTDNGTRLLTEELTIHPSDRTMDTKVQAQVKKDNIDIEGLGAEGDTNLKKVQFKKNVTVVIQDTQDQSKSPTVVTCDGPLVIDYEKNIAHFKNNVVAKDDRGTLKSKRMDVYYNRVSRKVSKIVALDHVVIENPDGNTTYSESVIYLAEEGRVILGGDTEALYYEDSHYNSKELEL